MKPQFPTPCLCLVTDRKACRQIPLEEIVAQAMAQGVNMVQLREKDLPAKSLLDLGHRLRDVTSRSALLVVNQSIDVTLACRADGVQLGEEAPSPEAALQMAGPDLLVGRSVHSLEGALAAEAQGADFLVVGTIFTSTSHPSTPPAGPGLLARIAQRIRIPFIGIGGINSSNVDRVVEAGAWGAAVISAILSSKVPGLAAKELREVMENSWGKSRVIGGKPSID